MPLVQSLPQSGIWLFRWRSFLPISMVVLACFAITPLPHAGHDSRWAVVFESLGLAVSFAGLGFRCITIGHTPAGTSGRNTKQQVAVSLNTTGVYSVVRHPLYFANFLIGFGLSVLTLNPWFIFVYILVFWLYYERIMMAEEQFLRQSFGQQFDDWVSVTPAFVPDLRRYVSAALPFSLRNVLRREYNTVLQIAVVSFLLELTGDWADNGKLTVSAPWLAFLFSGVAVWAVLRTIKRHTQWLNVADR